MGTTTKKPPLVPGPTKGTAFGMVINLSTAEWATALLKALQAKGYKTPVNAVNIANIQRWIGVESGGNTAGFMRDNNPLNLNTWASPHNSLPGGVLLHEWGVYVQTFPTMTAGIDATVQQFEANQSLIKVLEHSGAPSLFGGALSTSGWSSGHYANATTFPALDPFTGSSVLPFPITEAQAKGIAAYQAGAKQIASQNPAQAVKDVVAPITSVASFLGKISNPTTLKNVGIFVAGLALAGTGLLIFFSQTKTAKGVEGAAVKAAP